MIIVGVDPGKQGGLVALDAAGRVLARHRMPVDADGRYDVSAICDYLRWSSLADLAAGPLNAAIVIERPGIVRIANGYQAAATASLAECVGIVTGLAEACGVAWHHVPPSTWQADMGVARGMGGELDTKSQARELCAQLWPDERTSGRGGWSDGERDAALIARWWSRHRMARV